MRYPITFILFFLGTIFAFGQQKDAEKEKARDLAESTNITWEANKLLSEDKYVDAEADYRRAIAKSNENSAAPYNLGNAYYDHEDYSEAFGRYKEAGEVAKAKPDKHNAYHNMGNVFMKRKEYEKAVEAYKESLRNDPTDEETRYNYALAKELLKKQEQEQQNDQNKQDEDQDQNEKDQNKDQQKGDNGDQEEKDDSENKKNEDKQDNKEGEGDEKKEEKENQGEGDQQDQEKEQQQKRPNQLSPQQIQNLLEAMQNEEKKVQEKIDAQKVKGVKVKTEKDW